MSFDDQIRTALDSTTASLREHVEAELRAFSQEAARLAGEARQEAAELRTALEELRTNAQQQLDTAQRSAQADIEQARAELESARSELEKAHAEAIQARSAAEGARAEMDAARAETEAVRSRAQEEIERASSAAEQTTARARADFDQLELARAARLADAIRRLDQAAALSEVLERLVQCAADEVDRAAVLLVNGNRLTGWRLAGFAPNLSSASLIDLSIEDAGLAGAVVQTGVAASRSFDAAGSPGLPPFAGNAGDRRAMAFPLRVGGEVVAVLYADAAQVDASASDPRWSAILEVLVRHASRVLEAMTVRQTLLGSAP